MALIGASARHDHRNDGDGTSQIAERRLDGDHASGAVTKRRAVYLTRRLKLILFDLGLDRSVPADWIAPMENGLAFEELTLRQTDELIKKLENLNVRRQPLTPEPGPGQLSLFGGE